MATGHRRRTSKWKKWGEAKTTKRCTRCEETKPVAAFRQRANGRLRSWCTLCCVEYAKERHQDDMRKAQPRELSPQQREKMHKVAFADLAKAWTTALVDETVSD